MKIHNSRLVLKCVVLLTEMVRLALVLLNMANNYSFGGSDANQMV